MLALLSVQQLHTAQCGIQQAPGTAACSSHLHAAVVWKRVHTHRRVPGCLVQAGKGSIDPRLQEVVKQLTHSFYSSGTDNGANDQEAKNPTQEFFPGVQPSWRGSLPWPGLESLPLFVNDAVPTMPFSQRMLHVHLPLYAHMFEEIFARPRPWVFGLVSVKGGLKALCSSSSVNTTAHGYAADQDDAHFQSGGPKEATPAQQRAADAGVVPQGHEQVHAGVVMEVDRAVRLNTGALMILATSIARFQVNSFTQLSPYPRGHVRLSLDVEELHAWQASGSISSSIACTKATAGSSSSSNTHIFDEHAAGLDHASSSRSSSSSGSSASVFTHVHVAAATAACEAANEQWLDYEAAASRQQAWRYERGPREGRSEGEAAELLSDLVSNGVLEVLPLPDGPVIGRWDLTAINHAAQQAGNAAAAAVTTAPASSLQACSSSTTSSPIKPGAANREQGSSSITMAGAQLAQTCNEASDQSAGTAQGSPARTAQELPSLPLQGQQHQQQMHIWLGETAESCQQAWLCQEQQLLSIEALIWAELDRLATLSQRVRQGRGQILGQGPALSLPFGLLQLRPAARPVNLYSSGSPADGSGGVSAAGGMPAGAGTSAAVTPAPSSSDSSSAALKHPGLEDDDGLQEPEAVCVTEPLVLTAPQQPMPPPAGYAHAASEGLDVFANPQYPLLRRVQRLSYAVGAVVLNDCGEARAEFLATQSVHARLQVVLAKLLEHSKVLAAMAAVQGLAPGK